jgi:hypothetical protein
VVGFNAINIGTRIAIKTYQKITHQISHVPKLERDSRMASSSSNNGEGLTRKQIITKRVMTAFKKDVLLRDVLRDNYDDIKEQIDKRNALSRELICMPQSAIRDLAVLFMLDLSKSDSERLEIILKIMEDINVSMDLKIEFLNCYK